MNKFSFPLFVVYGKVHVYGLFSLLWPAKSLDANGG
jgi:hypothetical protein